MSEGVCSLFGSARCASTASVERLIEFLESGGMPTAIENVKREHLESFIEHLVETRAPATASNRFRAVKGFFAWATRDEEVIAESPMRNMASPRVPESPPDLVSEDEVRALLATCRGNAFDSRRDEAIIRLLYDTGARRSEVANLRLDDVDAALPQGARAKRRLAGWLGPRSSRRSSDPYARVSLRTRFTPRGTLAS